MWLFKKGGCLAAAMFVGDDVSNVYCLAHQMLPGLTFSLAGDRMQIGGRAQQWVRD